MSLGIEKLLKSKHPLYQYNTKEGFMALDFKIETPEEKKRNKILVDYTLKIGSVILVVLLIWVFLRYVAFDAKAPNVVVALPDNNLTLHTGEIEFKYTVEDASPLSSCQLLINNNPSANLSLNKSQLQSYKTNLLTGMYEWQISCTDKTILKNKGLSEKRKLRIIKPLQINNITKIEAPELKEGALILYAQTKKDSQGAEVAEILPKNAGFTVNSTALSSDGSLAIGLWGKPNLASQMISVYSDKKYDIYLPEYKNATNLLFYVADDGSTYHSFSSKNYNKANNGGRELPDLNWDEALSEKYLARGK